MGVGMKVTSGPAIERVGDLGSILTNLENGDVLFIDEIHRLNKLIEEVLYPAMEDYKLDIIIGKGPSARTIQLDLPKFTLIGATTRLGSISNPLRNRFGSVHRLEFYTEEEIARILTRSSRILNIGIDPSGAKRIAQASRHTPRVANHFHVNVALGNEAGTDGRTPEQLQDALTALLRDAARRQGLDV